MCRTEMCRFGVGNWIFLVACVHLFTYSQGGEDETMFSLSAEPQDLALMEGERAVLACGAPPPARVTWWYSAAAPPTRDHALPRADTHRKQLANGSLLIESMSAALAGQYQCVATVDGVGTIVSRLASVLLAEVPEMGEAPRVIIGVPGAPALLPCPLRPSPRLAIRVLPLAPERRVYGATRLQPPPLLKLNVTWLKSGSPVRTEAARVALSPGGALELDPLRAHDAAVYRCSVALAHSNSPPTLGPEIELRVNSEIANMESAPRFIATPQPVTVMEGASVTFDCAAVGNPKPEMVWLNNGVAIDLNDLDSRFYLAGSGSLRVVAARALDAGAYTCRATNRLDSADHSALLSVISPPRVTLRDVPPSGVVSAAARGDVTLRCDAKGRPPPRVQWLKDGEPLSPNHHDMAIVDGSSLRIRGVLAVDAGVFQCAAASTAGSAVAALRLRVTHDIIPNGPTPFSNSTHDIFNSLVSGDPDQTIDTPDDIDFLGETSSAYTSEPIYDDYIENGLDNYDYFHAAEDVDIASKKENASLVSAPRDLRAVIVKHRFVTLSWDEPEVALEDIVGYAVLYRVKGSERERLSRGEARHREMNVASLQPNTTYQFHALALTARARSPPTHVIEVTTPEEELTYGPPPDIQAEAINPHTLRVWWGEPPPIATGSPPPPPPTKYTVYYSEGESGREQSVQTETTSVTLSGLRAASSYSLRVSAAGGEGGEIRVRTASDTPAAPPANVSAQATGDTSIIVRWEAPPPRTHRGPLTGYKVRYRVVSGGAAGASGAAGRRRADSLTTPADTRRAELQGLEPAQTYQVRVCALNANGSGPFSEWATAHTAGRRRADSAVPSAPPPLTTRAGRDWISVWWGEGGGVEGGAGGGAGGGAARGYWLGWGLGVPDSHSRELPAHAHSHVIRGLESNSEYVISLRASNALGLGPAVYATVRTRAPDGDEPDEPDADETDEPDEMDEDDTPPLLPPVGLKVIMLSGTTAVVYWTDPTLPKGQTATDGRRYAVRWSGGGRARVHNASDLNCMLDDLRPHTKYEFAVKLIKGGRESAWSMIASNTSLEAAPASAPRDVRAAPASPAGRALDLVWTAPARPNGAITGYVIMYAIQRPGGGSGSGGAGGAGGAEEWTAVAVVGDRTRARLDRLRPRTTYMFKIQARNAKGLGPFSASLTYTTGFGGGEGGGLASATSAWLWASAGGACAVLALAAALALSLCCRRPRAPLSPDASTYQKASASAAIKPPDLWIHHDQMELKHMDKSLHSSAISAGSVEGSALMSSTLTLARGAPAPPAPPAPPPAEYEPARHPPPSLHSLDRRYVPTYVESRSASAGSDDTAVLRASPYTRCDYRDMPCLAMTGMGVGVGVGVGCTGTCERRRHHPDQSTPLLAGVAPLGSPQSSLASLHTQPPAPCGSGQCPLGACGAGDVYATAASARERGHYVAYEPLGPYAHRDSLSSDAGGQAGGHAGGHAGGQLGGHAGAAGGGSLQRRGCGALHSFTLPDTASDHSTPSHSKAGSVRETSPYKKSASSSPGHLPNRLQLGGGVSACPAELEPLTPSRSTERLQREMQNLEGLMKDLSAITQNHFHC